MASLIGFCSLLLAFLCTSQPACSQNSDQYIMLAIHRELLVPGWGANSSDYCSWNGVRCNPNQSVEWLQLSRRQLRGNISIISELKYMKWLDLSSNNFRGSIPYNLGKLSQLEFLDLSGNKFEGLIPSQLGGLRNLRALNLSDNSLDGEIPDELRSLEKLQAFHLSTNRLNGSIPSWVGNMTNLVVFTAYENFLSGRIPENLGLFSDLEVLNLHSNQLEGPIPPSVFASGKLEILILTVNNLEGNIPQSVGKCRRLSSLRIGNNKLVGAIPADIGNVTSLTYFEVDNNHLSGEIVPQLAHCSNLTLLNLAANGFTGSIPHEFGGLENLQELIVSSNSLVGEIPYSLLRLKNLSKLDLSHNRFNGSIPEDLCNMSRLQFLLLSENSFRGEIPREIGNCTRLLELQMGSNYLTGSIPPEIGRIRNLQVALNLSFNHLHGSVPRELGKLDKLVSIDISSNQLSGSIPTELNGMMSLIAVNFSNNLFSGPIPTFVPFQKSPSSSFVGNRGLCGQPLSSNCAGLSGEGKDATGHKVSYRIILAVIGSGLTVFVAVTVVVLLFMMREKQEKAVKDSCAVVDINQDPPSILASNLFVDNLKQAIDFECCIKATLKDSNKLTCGTFSVVYKAVMPSGLILSVKRLKSMDKTVSHHQNKMIRELERLGKLCHNNLLRPLGFVIYEDVVLLLHHYFPSGTLIQLLQDSSKSDHEPDWSRRLSIAIGAAEGLAFLHHVAIIHLDISTSNIFLDGNFNPLLGEIEISKLLDPSRGTASISAVAGSFGYIPPEYAYTMQVTAPGNVYSYGVVLLEILTTRLPVDEAFGEGIDLVKWVHSAPLRGETPEQILDARLSTVSFAWRKQMLGVLKIALMCTDSTPAKRPKMKKVVEMLKEVEHN